MRPAAAHYDRCGGNAARATGGVCLGLASARTPAREQRRQFFRIAVSLPAVLAVVADGVRADGSAVRATVVEVSEGGAVVRCRSALPDVGALVELGFALDGRLVVVRAEVLRHEVLADDRYRAAVRFLDPDAYGDEIRRFAFAVERARVRPPVT